MPFRPLKREELGVGRQHNTPKELGVKPESNEVESLKRQVNELAEQVKRLQSTRETRQSPASNIYCPHCKSTSHTLRECWRKPPPVMTVGDMVVGEAKRTAQERQVLVDDYQEDTPHLPSMLLLILGAIVDTGSGYTLIRESAAKRMGSEINKRHNTPSLQGVTGSPLRVLGMVWLEIGVGGTEVHKQWFPVVPDHYFSVDVLLGCDVLC